MSRYQSSLSASSTTTVSNTSSSTSRTQFGLALPILFVLRKAKIETILQHSEFETVPFHHDDICLVPPERRQHALHRRASRLDNARARSMRNSIASRILESSYIVHNYVLKIKRESMQLLCKKNLISFASACLNRFSTRSTSHSFISQNSSIVSTSVQKANPNGPIKFMRSFSYLILALPYLSSTPKQTIRKNALNVIATNSNVAKRRTQLIKDVSFLAHNPGK